MTNPVFVALDTPDLAKAEMLATSLAGSIGGLKLGLEFFAANGPVGVGGLPREACRSSST